MATLSLAVVAIFAAAMLTISVRVFTRWPCVRTTRCSAPEAHGGKSADSTGPGTLRAPRSSNDYSDQFD